MGEPALTNALMAFEEAMDAHATPEAVKVAYLKLESALRSNTGAQQASEERERDWRPEAALYRLANDARARHKGNDPALEWAEQDVALILRALRSSPPVAPACDCETTPHGTDPTMCRLHAPVAPEGWRPIETAPKYETVALFDGNAVYAGHATDGRPIVHGWGVARITHWHPLPTPPGAARPPAGDER